MGQGDALSSKNEHAAAARAYYEAASLESEAFRLIPAERVRTRGIIALSHVNLLTRAGAIEEAVAAATKYLSDETLPRWATTEAAAIARALIPSGSPPFEHRRPKTWRNPSILRLAGDRDPIEVVTQAARAVVYTAMERGWSGPPFDPMELAELMGVVTEPSAGVLDAEVALADASFVIRYNPNKPPARIRYSVAHDLAHTLFPDAAAAVRARGPQPHPGAHDWELELLCNLAAAELLMPAGSFSIREIEPVGVDQLLEMQDDYALSVEALALRTVQLSGIQVAAFAASYDAKTSRYRVDYFVQSRSWRGWRPGRGFGLPTRTVVADCTAVGWKAKGVERWGRQTYEVDAVGVPPYPDTLLPRVVGFVSPPTAERGELQVQRLHFVRGNALRPRGEGSKLLMQIVNDRTPRWGAGFARQVREKWPHVQKSFIEWTQGDPSRLVLGNVHVADAEDDLKVVSMVAQKGYGESKRARIRYEALRICLAHAGDLATQLSAPIHAPRIGTGYAGGNWAVIRGLIEEQLVSRTVAVWIYDPLTDEEVIADEAQHAVHEASTQLGLGMADGDS